MAAEAAIYSTGGVERAYGINIHLSVEGSNIFNVLCMLYRPVSCDSVPFEDTLFT